MNENNLIGLKMIQKRDGIPIGSFLRVQRYGNAFYSVYAGRNIPYNWLKSAVADRKAKWVFRDYALM